MWLWKSKARKAFTIRTYVPVYAQSIKYNSTVKTKLTLNYRIHSVHLTIYASHVLLVKYEIKFFIVIYKFFLLQNAF